MHTLLLTTQRGHLAYLGLGKASWQRQPSRDFQRMNRVKRGQQKDICVYVNIGIFLFYCGKKKT